VHKRPPATHLATTSTLDVLDAAIPKSVLLRIRTRAYRATLDMAIQSAIFKQHYIKRNNNF
jgi:hypothetical protein